MRLQAAQDALLLYSLCPAAEHSKVSSRRVGCNGVGMPRRRQACAPSTMILKARPPLLLLLQEGHPEGPERIAAIHSALDASGLASHPAVARLEPPSLTDAAARQALSQRLQLVHPKGYLRRLAEICGSLEVWSTARDTIAGCMCPLQHGVGGWRALRRRTRPRAASVWWEACSSNSSQPPAHCRPPTACPHNIHRGQPWWMTAHTLLAAP